MTVLIAVIVFLVLLALAAVVLALVGKRESNRALGRLTRETRSRDKQARKAELKSRRQALASVESEVPATWTPPDEREVGIARRQFLNRGLVALFAVGIGGFAANALRFLWPQGSGGFGSKISIGSISDINTNIEKNNGFYYVPEGKLWITKYPPYAVVKAKAVYQAPVLASLEAGLAVMYQKCPHLGCRVPSCLTSKWFECPCHGSQYNQAGEKKGGPAPRGMDRFATSVSGGSLTVDTGTVILGPPIGTDTTGQEAEGPHCV